MQLAAVAAANIVNTAQKQPLAEVRIAVGCGLQLQSQCELELELCLCVFVCVSGDMHKMHVVYEQLQTISLA